MNKRYQPPISGHESILDWEKSVKLANNNSQLAKEMLQMLLTELPDVYAAIIAKHRTNDWVGLYELIHRIHGAACYCGVPRLQSVLSKIENNLKMNNTSHIDQYIDILSTEINLLQTTVAKNDLLKGEHANDK
ncbi:MAG: Hpt domain-containing protein [Coxiellaceae bacterium]|nr:MAG: Hpt domain-containing protein [Coxiellaceae bacterium]